MNDAEQFSGRVAIVTGAGKGLGRAYAKWLGERGCAVVVNNRLSGASAESSAEAVVREIIDKGGRAVAHHGPVEDPKSAMSMTKLAQDAFGGLDILVANAGIQRYVHFSEMTAEEFRSIVDVNLWGTFYPLKAAWDVMVANGYGRIVLTGSGAGLWGQPSSVHYSATKAAMQGIARSLALDVPKEADIRINVIAPAAYTPMSASAIDAKWADFMSADRVAPVIGWLASEQCDVNGAIFHSGASRIQRVRILEGERLEIDGDLTEIVHALGGPEEPHSSFGAGARLMPELFEKKAGT